MIFWLSSEILEDRLFPVAFHVVPVLDLSVTNRIVYAITRSLGVGKCFISDEEVKVFNAALGC